LDLDTTCCNCTSIFPSVILGRGNGNGNGKATATATAASPPSSKMALREFKAPVDYEAQQSWLFPSIAYMA
jgi:hypothetical protein